LSTNYDDKDLSASIELEIVLAPIAQQFVEDFGYLVDVTSDDLDLDDVEDTPNTKTLNDILSAIMTSSMMDVLDENAQYHVEYKNLVEYISYLAESTFSSQFLEFLFGQSISLTQIIEDVSYLLQKPSDDLFQLLMELVPYLDMQQQPTQQMIDQWRGRLDDITLFIEGQFKDGFAQIEQDLAGFIQEFLDENSDQLNGFEVMAVSDLVDQVVEIKDSYLEEFDESIMGIDFILDMLAGNVGSVTVAIAIVA
jgi:hypothetical protein